ncbi:MULTISPECIES: DsbE family thiol:disulfide interchange protein [Acidiphilium]|jgi:cytochrome c biogenesis protein CcmG/thiol:disulfide interchange protein DsbE|uniref:Alkyl hydroperoxide reductase/ Thiol specific antioxidant/ Mal allergen n=2 Tax=Acidiphilium TaxID=522 RepID=A5G2G3_ACICJ|nr:MULTISPECIES: DsbE family thiol:disulfide interchange protein [Acidiphilium]MBU6356079.1 DsbE family thiol:disulfide interchange protein [Rhodospirillales bacterium]ABQ32045.1 alkyl hydroperoxide reductase/ Thiol specific antioxidant/ Mal allergen [Acidiphilium cryptum JF-5]EGO96255.1 Alkyl hydroperoxide reductase/ Thiol specific antioxidant/ Mal allergen [Acidiphilium sp. PM]KDM68078.1 thiol:disulfide interchange protein CycY [Acidiphilium sp. JA12-A1]MBS3022725.1 DsbE family thiol:disulfi
MSVSRRMLFGLPLLVVGAGGVGFYELLRRMRTGSYNPQAFDNPLVGHDVPDFTLPGVNGRKGFDKPVLAAQKRPVLVNFFASWCVPCAGEAPYLDRLAKAGVDIWGIAYQDKPEAIALYLAKYGNPYARLATDPSGRTAINWGVYGVPESFLIAPGGKVVWHIAAPLVPEIIDDQLRPAMQRLT